MHPSLRVCGRWIPAELFGKGRALCSTLRLWYLTVRWIIIKGGLANQMVVLDVLPTPLPFLRSYTMAHILFYCHFPDQLLTRATEISPMRQLYRKFLNWMEDSTMPFADTIVVNSKFTRSVVRETFASLKFVDLPVLYPALDTASLDAALWKDQNMSIQQSEGHDDNKNSKAAARPIVSLNRYERKKNLQLLLEAAQWIRENHPQVAIPPIVIAGGYDVHNVENVEYRGELGKLVNACGLQDVVTFRQSISDQERQELLWTALCVVYTPNNEHFGIVPLEAMYCRTPVLAVNSGGPTESVVDGETGFLRPPSAADFGRALLTWIQDPSKATRMGEAGRNHVQERFGFSPRLVDEWRDLLAMTNENGDKRQRISPYHGFEVGHSLVYIMEAVVIILLCLLLTYVLRQLELLETNESLISGIKRGFQREEL